jgi:hypothetical protein
MEKQAYTQALELLESLEEKGTRTRNTDRTHIYCGAKEKKEIAYALATILNVQNRESGTEIYLAMRKKILELAKEKK